MLLSQICSEEKRFDINDVADGVCKKFIERHPHVFGEVVADTSEEVLRNWDDIKRKEKKQIDKAMKEYEEYLEKYMMDMDFGDDELDEMFEEFPFF